MFTSTSRYYTIENATLIVTDQDGGKRTLVYKRRRFTPSSGALTTLTEYTVTQGDRLDNITARYLDAPTEFWQVCDVNNVLHPCELEEVGKVIKIALPIV
jgi:hypothetical protein